MTIALTLVAAATIGWATAATAAPQHFGKDRRRLLKAVTAKGHAAPREKQSPAAATAEPRAMRAAAHAPSRDPVAALGC